VDAIYPRYALADLTFYEDPARRASDAGERFSLDAGLAWDGWDNHDDGHWSFWHRRGSTLPPQGWKIHVSSVVDGADEVLREASRFCHGRGMAFKHLPHRGSLRAANSKDAERATAGKFITVYTVDEGELHDTLVELDGLIGGMPGPYVLSDLRWNAGPLSVRYGAFARLTFRRDGVEVAALRDPRTDALVEDVRTTAFVPPEWVSLPPFLQAQVDALGEAVRPEGFPDVTGALHHSNAGGVYLARDGDERVVVKEARPHTGFTPDDRDAVSRLRHEEVVLRSIRSSQTAGVRDSFDLHGHRYLVMDHLDGQSLNTEVVARNPRVRATSTAAERRAYRDWALGIIGHVRAAVAALHDAGYSHGDLHPGNVIVRPDDTIALLDFEMAQPVELETPPVVGAPGFVPPDLRGGTHHDLYALACMELYVFVPLTVLLPLDPEKAGDLLRAAESEFDLPGGWAARLAEALRVEAPGAEGEAERRRASPAIERLEIDTVTALAPAIEAVASAITADADFARDERLWPGDPAQFFESPYGLAHGAIGVAYALTAAGEPVDPRVWDWIDDRMLRQAEPAALGLYDGLAGAVWAFRRMGRHAQADQQLDRLRGVELDRLGDDLYGGLAGVGLTLVSESDADSTLLTPALGIARALDARLSDRPRPGGSAIATGSGGLLRGRSGTALFAIDLYERTGDAAHLRLAERAIDDDLASLVRAADGSMQVDEGWRILPYLGSGSAGIGIVLARLAEHLPGSDRHIEALDGIIRASTARFVIQSGLFNGRAGLIHFLLALARRGLSTPESDAALARHVRELRLHAIRRPHGIGFPGDGLMRLSDDLATGSAGVLTALTAYRAFVSGEDPAKAGLPFLTPPAPSTRAWPSLAEHLTERG
jgi:tRNA A-37 threonylcarbamoyl transferase component Bud32